jgi:hypothetical protein
MVAGILGAGLFWGRERCTVGGGVRGGVMREMEENEQIYFSFFFNVAEKVRIIQNF